MDRHVVTLVENLHAHQPIRVWSLVITVFGDLIVPRGRKVWLGTILALMDELGITANAVRAAMSRLTADGWLNRDRIGRNSYYELAAAREREFTNAFHRIYAMSAPDWSQKWRISVLTSPDQRVRDDLRANLRAKGYGSVSGGVFFRPDRVDDIDPNIDTDGIINFDATSLGDVDRMRELVRTAWELEDIAAALVGVIDNFQPLSDAMDAGLSLSPMDSLIARLLLIHQFRRVALQDPLLPKELMDADWPGETARALSSKLYRQLLVDSEIWLDRNAKSPDGSLPPPDADFYRRFEGLAELTDVS